MGIEPYLIRSGLMVVVSQRLRGGFLTQSHQPMRTICSVCPVRHAGRPSAAIFAGAPATAVEPCWRNCSCPMPKCWPWPVLARSDVHQLEQVAVAAGMTDRWERACIAVEVGLTSPAEVRASSESPRCDSPTHVRLS